MTGTCNTYGLHLNLMPRYMDMSKIKSLLLEWMHPNLMCRYIKILKYDERNYIDNILQFVYNINCRIYLLYKK